MRWLALPALVLALLAAGSIEPPAAPAHLGHDLCARFQNQALAQYYFLTHGGPTRDPHGMDEDGDGIACESLPCPCDLSTTPPPPPTPLPDRDRDAVPDEKDLCADVFARTLDGCPPPPPDPADRSPTREFLSGVVTGVVDGRTLRVRGGGRTQTVRLVGLDAPRVAAGGRRAECGALQSRSTLLWLTFTAPRDADGDGRLDRSGGRGAPVEIETDPALPARDARGRLNGYVTVDGADLARAQLRRGWATVDLGPDPFAKLAGYKALEASARKARRGLWGRCRAAGAP